MYIYIYIDNDHEMRIYDDLGDTIFLDEQIALRQSDASRQSEGRRHVDVWKDIQIFDGAERCRTVYTCSTTCGLWELKI